MEVRISIQNRDRKEIGSITFEHEANEHYIQLTDRTGSTISVLDPLTNVVNMILPTYSEIEVDTGEPVGPEKGSASPGDIFPEDPSVSAEDQPTADSLVGLGYIADPQTSWAPGSFITIGIYNFTWLGNWTAGKGMVEE